MSSLPIDKVSTSLRGRLLTNFRWIWPLPVVVTRTMVIVAFLAVWEISVVRGWVDPTLVAKPTSVLTEMFSIVRLPEIQSAFRTTIGEYVLGFSAGASIGIATGLFLALVRPAYRVLYGPLMAIYATPKSIFIPLFIVFLGLGTTSVAAYAALGAVFPLIIAVVAGVDDVDQRLTVAAISMGATRTQRLRFVVVPTIIPSTISGIWLGSKQALLAVLLAEFLISSGKNVGYYITLYASTFRPEKVYALIMWLALFALAVAWFWARIDSYTQRWRAADRSRT